MEHKAPTGRGGTRDNHGPTNTKLWEVLPEICPWHRANRPQKPVKWCVLHWNADFSFQSDYNTSLLLTWTADTKSGHISDVRHISWARCCQKVHNRPVLPWQCMQPISALQGLHICRSLHFRLRYLDHDWPNLPCSELHLGASHCSTHEYSWRHHYAPPPPSEHPVMKSCGFQPSTDRKSPSGWATVPGFIRRVRVCYSLTVQSNFGTQCSHFAFARAQNPATLLLTTILVSLSVCPLIKSMLYKYTATDGYSETSNEHVTEGHTIIALIINKPNMASCELGYESIGTVHERGLLWPNLKRPDHKYSQCSTHL
jgi:hypothetical protein